MTNIYTNAIAAVAMMALVGHFLYANWTLVRKIQLFDFPDRKKKLEGPTAYKPKKLHDSDRFMVIANMRNSSFEYIVTDKATQARLTTSQRPEQLTDLFIKTLFQNDAQKH